MVQDVVKRVDEVGSFTRRRVFDVVSSKSHRPFQKMILTGDGTCGSASTACRVLLSLAELAPAKRYSMYSVQYSAMQLLRVHSTTSFLFLTFFSFSLLLFLSFLSKGKRKKNDERVTDSFYKKKKTFVQ